MKVLKSKKSITRKIKKKTEIKILLPRKKRPVLKRISKCLNLTKLQNKPKKKKKINAFKKRERIHWEILLKNTNLINGPFLRKGKRSNYIDSHIELKQYIRNQIKRLKIT